MAARLAAEDSRKLTLPANPDAYELKLPATFAPPEGVTAEIDTTNPLWSQARAWAHKNGLSQEAFADGVALVMGDRVGTAAGIKRIFDANIAALGPTGPARVDAVTTWMRAVGGPEHGAALAGILKLAPVASTIKALESVMAKMAHTGSFTTSGREPPAAAGKLSNDDFNKLSVADQWAYARSHQPARAN